MGFKFSREAKAYLKEETTAEWEVNDDSTDLLLNNEEETELEAMASTKDSFLYWKHHDY